MLCGLYYYISFYYNIFPLVICVRVWRRPLVFKEARSLLNRADSGIISHTFVLSAAAYTSRNCFYHPDATLDFIPFFASFFLRNWIEIENWRLIAFKAKHLRSAAYIYMHTYTRK